MSLASSLKKNIDSLVAAAAGFFIIFLFTRHGGIGICPDAVVYSTTAENLHTTGRLEDYGQGPLIDFPAFYPVFLSALMLLTGLKPLLFAPYLNALLFAVLIYLAGYIMEQFSYRSRWYKTAVLSCIVLSPALLEDYSMLWSETLFMVWLLLFMIALHRYFQSYSRNALIAAAMMASLACVTRYAGITIIATGGLLLLLDMKLPWQRKLTDLVLYSLISPLLLIINLARNYAVSGTMMGDREKSITSLSENTQDVGSVFCDWLPFLHRHHAAEIGIVVLAIAGLVFLSLRQLWRHRRITNYENIAAVFSLIYVLFMIITATISRFETLNSRFLSPAFIPLLWSGSSWIVPASQQSNKPAKKWLMVLAGAFIFLSFQYNQYEIDSNTWEDVKDAGIPGYTEDQWRYSETVLYIQKDSLPFKKDYSVYSDADDAIYFFTGKIANYLPHKDSKEEVQEFLNDPHCYLVWFNDGADSDLVDLDFVTNVKKMKLVKQFNDGAIYEFDGKK
jgi:hypothetical protein